MFVLLSFLLGTTADPAQALATRVRQTYRTGGDLQADFSQSYTDNVRHKTRTEHGVLRVKADGRLRWTYAGDEAKEFIYDGKTAYFSEPENGQVTVFEHFARSPLFNALQFLWGGQDLQQNFDIAFAQDADHCQSAGTGQRVLRLKPKQSMPALDHACLLIDEKTAQVRGSRILDPMGSVTDYTFSHLVFQAHIEDAQFHFQMRQDVSVLRAPE